MNHRLSELIGAAIVGAVLVAPRVSDADAPPGHYVIGTGAKAGTVYDTKSKLTWQQTAATTSYRWSNARSYCSTLSLDGLGWRLPTEKELFSLVDRSQTAAPYVDTSAFPGASANSGFWSSSLAPGYPPAAWSMDYGDGNTYPSFADNTASVRCVR